MLLAFYGVFVMMTGKGEDDDDKTVEPEGSSQSIKLDSILVLLCAPILIAAGSIALRALRSISEFATGTYISLLGIIVYGISVSCSENGFLFPTVFTLSDYLVVVVIAVLGSFSLIMRAKAA